MDSSIDFYPVCRGPRHVWASIAGVVVAGLALGAYASNSAWAQEQVRGGDQQEAGRPASPDESVELDSMELPLVFKEDFEDGVTRWQTTDDSAWDCKVEQASAGNAEDKSGAGAGSNHVFGLNKRTSEYQPPHRSPHNMALIKDIELADFVLLFKVKSTRDTGNHRDCCAFFAYQNAAQFYYVHLGARPDPNSGQIMLVKDAPRRALTENESEVPWDDQWHQVKLTRNSQTGQIHVYFDDMAQPLMSIVDKTYGKGSIGIGSFDDMNDFDDVLLYGK